MAVATSSRSDALPPKVENHKEMFDRLEFVVCGDDPEVRQESCWFVVSAKDRLTREFTFDSFIG
jgi:hypothetical protein